MDRFVMIIDKPHRCAFIYVYDSTQTTLTRRRRNAFQLQILNGPFANNTGDQTMKLTMACFTQAPLPEDAQL